MNEQKKYLIKNENIKKISKKKQLFSEFKNYGNILYIRYNVSKNV